MRINTINIIQNANPNGIIIKRTLTLPIASVNGLGGVKPGTNVKVNTSTGEMIFELTQDIIDEILAQVEIPDSGGSTTVPTTDTESISISDGTDVQWTIKLGADGQTLVFANASGTEVLQLTQTGAISADGEVTAFNQ